MLSFHELVDLLDTVFGTFGGVVESEKENCAFLSSIDYMQVAHATATKCFSDL